MFRILWGREAATGGGQLNGIFLKRFQHRCFHVNFAKVSFVVSWCQFLKAILKTFHEIALAFLPVEIKRNILYVNINLTENLFFVFGKYRRGKVGPEATVSHPFWALALTKNVSSIFLSRWHLVNDSRSKRVSAFLLCFFGFETINFYVFSIKMSCFESKFFF